jgi:hypothetical protein
LPIFCLADSFFDLINRFAQDLGRLLDSQFLLLGQFELDMLPDAATTYDGGHGQAHVSHSIGALLKCADG